MQIDIAAHIEKLLFEYETVIIPGFGGFTTTKYPAAVDMVGGSVAPPTKSISFNENLTVDDGILVHQIAHHTGLSSDEARRSILEYVEKVKTALDQREIINIAGIGRLYKNYAQKIQFLPDATNFNSESFGLPALQFAPVARARQVAEPTPSVETPVYETSTVTDPAPVAAESNMAEISVNDAFTAVPTLAQPTGELPVPAADQAVQNNYTAPIREKSGFNSMPLFLGALGLFTLAVALWYFQKKKTEHPLVVAKDAVTTPVDKPTTPLGGVTDLNEVEKNAKKKVEQPAKEAAIADKDEDPSNGDTSDEVEEAAIKRREAESKSKIEPTKDKALAQEVDSGKRCVLVVGTYQEKANAQKVIDKIKGAGLDLYYRHQKGHQVGIEFNYENMTEVQEKIKTLQQLTGEDEIWIKRK